MMRTNLADTFDLTWPVLAAGMPFAGRPPLVAAVGNAGGMGFLSVDAASTRQLAEMIRATRRLTNRPFGVSFSAPFVTKELLEQCVLEKPAVVAFSRDPSGIPSVTELRNEGIAVWRHVASPEEGRLAARQGADAVIVDGGEVTSTPPYWALLELLPAIGEAVFPIPTIAAGGIADGRRLATALVLGAEAVWCGARFLAATEAAGLGRANPSLPNRPAAEIVRQLSWEATLVLNSLHSTLRGPDSPLV